jgi:hypothetical protein
MVPFACMPSPLPRQVGWNLFARTIPSASAFPRNRGGSAPASLFSGPARRSLTLRPARSPSRLATFCTRGFSSLVASTAALIATGWSEPVPGRVYPRCGPAPSRRTRLTCYTTSLYLIDFKCALSFGEAQALPGDSSIRASGMRTNDHRLTYTRGSRMTLGRAGNRNVETLKLPKLSFLRLVET